MREQIHLDDPECEIGADPEAFLARAGYKKPYIIGSETVMPEPIYNYGHDVKICPDGVQVEMHPGPYECREAFTYDIHQCLKLIHETAEKHGLVVDFSKVVTVKTNELIKLSDHAKWLGCKPSFNFYGRPMKVVDGMKYRKRSAAGHIHIGSPFIETLEPAGAIRRIVIPDRLVPACDILLGIPSVMMDRDPANIERRKLYGRAGEYRLPKYGFEYRTLSNYWLLSRQLTSFVAAQAKTAFAVSYSEARWPDAPSGQILNRLIQLADLKRVEKAINKNDADLAFKVYEEALKPVMSEVYGERGLLPNSEARDGIFKDFEYFISKPLTEWFPRSPLENWDRITGGWESFMAYTVRPQRLRAEGLAQ